ncbi:MAG: hypothetical protein ABR521_11425, partial [Gaiellaceae bacterium]
TQCSRRAAGGRPGDRIFGRDACADLRRLTVIATPLTQVLRQPIESAQVAPSPDDPAAVVVSMLAQNLNWTFVAFHPLEFYEQLRNSDIRVDGEVVWQGHQGRQEFASFDIRGDFIFLANGAVDLRVSSVRLDGTIRLLAAQLIQPANLQISATGRTQLWLGGRFADSYPWSQYPSELEAPVTPEPATELERLLARCAERLPAGSPLTLNRDYMPVEDQRLAWLDREFSTDHFSLMVRFLVDHQLATAQAAQASGSTPMVRVHFRWNWERLLQALRTPHLVDHELAERMGELQQILPNRR